MKNMIRTLSIGAAMTFLSLGAVTPAAALPVIPPGIGVDIELAWCGKCWGWK